MSHNRLGAALLLAASWCLHSPRASAQGCCSAGGAAAQIGHFRQSQLGVGQGVFAFYYGHTRADRSYENSTTVDDPMNRRASLSTLSGSFAIGMPWGFTAYASAPLAWRTREQLTTYAGQTVDAGYNGAGWADPVVALSWRFVSPATASGWLAAVGSGLQIPLGEDEVRTDGVRLPNDIQPATGDWNVLMFQSVEWTRDRWTLYEHSTWTATWANTVGYRLGPSVRADVGASFSYTHWLEPYVRFDLLAAQGDESRGRELPSTGSTRLYGVPGLAFNLRPQRLLLSGEVGVPLYQNFTGNQLGTSLTWSVGFSYLL